MNPMPIMLLLTACIILPACNTAATVSVNGITVKTSGRVGGQGGLYVRNGATEIQTWDDNQESFRELAKTARFTGGVIGAVSVAKSITSAVQSVKNTSTAAGVTNTAAKEGTKQAAIAAETEAARIAAESAAAEAALVLPPVP